MKKLSLWVLGAIVAVCLIGYGFGVYHYQSHFLPETVVSGVDVSGMTAEEADTAVSDSINNASVQVKENDSTIADVQLAEAGFSPKNDQQLADTLNSQSAFTWPVDFVGKALTSVEANTQGEWQVDKDKFSGYFETLNIDQTDREPSKNAQVTLDEETKTVEVVPETQGTEVNSDSLADALLTAINEGQKEVDLAEAYVKPSVTSEDETIQSSKATLEKILSATIGLQIEDEVVNIPAESIASWVSTDDKGEVRVDAEAVDNYLYEWNVENAGLNQSHQFQSTASGEVTVDPGIYGWYIEREATTEQVIEAVKKGEDVVLEPTIWGQGYDQDQYFGNSYIEVDLSKQKMFVYLEGEQKISTDIVSGNIGTDTVPGAYELWDKQSPSVLRGYNPRTKKDYQQPVDYWMPFDYTGQGIHDANWQSNFGGEVYKQSGSLGCINTPPNVMAQVYDMAYIGLPVIVF